MTNDPTPNSAYQLSVRVAAVAGVFAVVVAALLLYDYVRRPYDYARWRPTDPLEDATFLGLKAELAKQPSSDGLKGLIRARDLDLRQEYFRQRTFAAVGAVMLLAGVVVFLVAARSAATLRRLLPHPQPPEMLHDHELVANRLARWAVGALALVLAAGAVGWAFASRSELPRDDKELAALLQPPQRESVTEEPENGGEGEEGDLPRKPAEKKETEGEKGKGRPPKETEKPEKEPMVPAEALPSDEEIAKAWPRFRGPGGFGISAYDNIPEKWDASTGENIAWKTELPLPGNSSPVVWGDRVFLTGASDTQREVYCFDAHKGTLLWRKAAHGTHESAGPPPKVNNDTGFAASTAASDGRRVFAIFANGDVAAYDFNGKPAWSRSLGLPENAYGHASSLAMYKNTLLVQLDQGQAKDKRSKFLALDAATGKTVWEVVREVPNSWTTPIVIRVAGRDQLITAADPWVIAYNPANGQEEIWRSKSLRQDVGPSPTFCDGVVYVANQFPCLSAIRADGEGDVTKTHVLWKGEDGLPDTCSPLATPQHVFLLASEGTLTCYDAKAGDKLWEKDFEGILFTASPSLVGKRLYLIGNKDDVGKGFVVEPGQDDCKVLFENDLGEKCVASPAFQDGRMYVRGEKSLFCIGKK